MSSCRILCRLPLWVNYQTIITYHNGDGYDITLQNHEWPPSRRWKRCLGEIAVFHFNQPISNLEVIQNIRRAGFVPGDIWCLVSFLRSLDTLSTCCKPACIVAPAGIIYDRRHGRVSPFLTEISGKVLVNFVRRPGSDWCGYWLPYWKFLAVRWTGRVIDDFWTSEYQPEQVLISQDTLAIT